MNHAKRTPEQYLANDIYIFVNYEQLQQAAHACHRVMKEPREFYGKMILKALPVDDKLQGDETLLQKLIHMFKGKGESHIMEVFVLPREGKLCV